MCTGQIMCECRIGHAIVAWHRWHAVTVRTLTITQYSPTYCVLHALLAIWTSTQQLCAEEF
jgi:hypothetical protein